MKRLSHACAMLALVLAAVVAEAGVAVVVHPSTPVDRLTAEQVTQLFLARVKTFPDGTPARPLDLPEGSPLRVQFFERVLGRTEQQMRSHWSRMIFTGKGEPPRNVSTAAEVLRLVASTPGFIGYIGTADVVPGRVKVVYSVE